MQLKLGKTVINLSFFFVAVIAFMLLLCDEEIVLVSLFASFFHEGGHLFFILLFSEAPKKISFGAFGIRIDRNVESNISYRKEALIAAGGIIGNLILSGLSFVIFCFTEYRVSLELIAVNLFVAAFNLLPVRQLDAGRVIYCLLQAFTDTGKSERIMHFITVSVTVIIFICCVLYNIFLGFNLSLIAVTAYLILITISKEFNNDK